MAKQKPANPGRGPPLPAASHPELTTDERDIIIRRDGFCALSRQGPPSVPFDVAHVVPYAIGKYFDDNASPFYRLVALLYPGMWQRVWQSSGGAHVNNNSNLMVLAPTYHRMYDHATVSLVPAFDRLMYQVRFLYPQLAWCYTVPVNNFACAELRVEGPMALCESELGMGYEQ